MAIPGHERSQVVPNDLIRTVDREDLPADTVARFLKLADLTPSIADALDQLDIDVEVLPSPPLAHVAGATRLVGPATTLRYAPIAGDTSTLRRSGEPARLGDKDALAHARAGDVLVIDTGANRTDAVLGDRTAARLDHGGVAGAIVHGAVRDVGSIDATGFAVWALGCTPRNALHRLETAEINGPVEFAGLTIRPGDLIAADDNGLVVVPHRHIAQVLAVAEELEGIS